MDLKMRPNTQVKIILSLVLLVSSSKVWAQPTPPSGGSKVVIVDGLPVVASPEPITPPSPVPNAIPVIPAIELKGASRFTWRGSEYGIRNGYWYQKIHVFDSHLKDKRAAYLLVLRMMQTRLLQMHESTDPSKRLDYAMEPGESFQKWGSQTELARAALEQMVRNQFSTDGRSPRRDATNWLPIDPRLVQSEYEHALLRRNLQDTRDGFYDGTGVTLNPEFFKETLVDLLPTAYLMGFSLRFNWVAKWVDAKKENTSNPVLKPLLQILRAIAVRGNAVSIAAIGVPSVYYRIPIFPCSTERRISQLPEEERANAIKKCRDQYVSTAIQPEWGLANDVSFYVWTSQLEGMFRVSAGLVTGLYNSRDFAKYWGREGVSGPVNVLANLFVPSGLGGSKVLENTTLADWSKRLDVAGGGFARLKPLAPVLSTMSNLPLHLIAFGGLQFGRDDQRGTRVPAHLYTGVGIEPGRVLDYIPMRKGFVNIWHVSDFVRMVEWAFEKVSVTLKDQGAALPPELTEERTPVLVDPSAPKKEAPPILPGPQNTPPLLD